MSIRRISIAAALGLLFALALGARPAVATLASTPVPGDQTNPSYISQAPAPSDQTSPSFIS